MLLLLLLLLLLHVDIEGDVGDGVDYNVRSLKSMRLPWRLSHQWLCLKIRQETSYPIGK